MTVPEYQFTEDNWNNDDVSEDHQEFLRTMGRIAQDYDKQITEINFLDYADIS